MAADVPKFWERRVGARNKRGGGKPDASAVSPHPGSFRRLSREPGETQNETPNKKLDAYFLFLLKFVFFS